MEGRERERERKGKEYIATVTANFASPERKKGKLHFFGTLIVSSVVPKQQHSLSLFIISLQDIFFFRSFDVVSVLLCVPLGIFLFLVS